MKKFKQYLAEQSMTPDEALAQLGLTVDQINDTSLKKAYRTAAMKAHPDRGGSDEQMQAINAAYDILKNAKFSDVNRRGDVWAEEKKMAESYLKTIDPDEFADHLSSVFGVDLKVTDKMNVGDHLANRVMEFASADRETVIIARFSFYYANFKSTNSLGNSTTGDLIPADVATSYEILHNRQKMKLSRSTFDMSKYATVLIDPSVLFPEAKIKKKIDLSQGGESQTVWMKKRDFITTLANKFSSGKMVRGDVYQIRFGNKMTIQGTRQTMQRKGFWNFHLFPRDRNAEFMPTIPETNTGLDIALDMIESVARSSDPVSEWNRYAKYLKRDDIKNTLFPGE